MAVTVTVNGEAKTVPDACSVERLLVDLGLEKAACAVEVNAELVPKRDHPEHELSEGDSIEIVTLVGGG